MTKELIRQKLLETLDEMAARAEGNKMDGVAIACYLPAGETFDWIGEMKVVNVVHRTQENDKGLNYIAIAWSKAAEMTASGKNSGDSSRNYWGELGWDGGAFSEENGAKFAFAFSGGTSEEDFELSKWGIEVMKKKLAE